MVFAGAHPEFGIFILRLAVAIVFLARGPAKIMQPRIIAKHAPLGNNPALLMGLLETAGAILLLLGAYIHIAVFFLLVSALREIYAKIEVRGISFTRQGGWALDFIILACLLAILISPGSTYSVL